MKRDELIKAIGDKLIDGIFEIDPDNYEYDPDPEFGGFDASTHKCIPIEVGNGCCDVDFSVTWPYRGGSSIEVILNGGEGKKEKTWKNLDRLNDAVESYVQEHLDTDDLLSAIKDDIREANEDEWESHGFRDAADYYHWRYG